MIRKGSLVKALKPHGRIWQGRYLLVADAKENEAVVYVERNAKGKWLTASLPKADIEEVVS